MHWLTGLECTGLNWIDWIGWKWVGLDWNDWNIFDCKRLDWTRLKLDFKRI